MGDDVRGRTADGGLADWVLASERRGAEAAIERYSRHDPLGWEIISANQTVLKLLDEIERLRARLDEVSEHRDELADRLRPRDVDLKMLHVIATMWQDESIEARHHARMLDSLIAELQRVRQEDDDE